MNKTFLIDDEDRYARLRLIAWWDQQRLAQSRVLVVGAGALGNEVLKNLALLGVGTIYIVDFDRVENSNLTRAVLFRRRDCGRPKAEVAAEAIRELNPDIRVKAMHANIITDVGLGLFREVNVVVGCLDNREARLWVNRQCWKVTRPWVDGGIQEINGVVKVFIPPDSPCYECGMTEMDYRLINLRYSCPLLRHEDLQAGKVPTSPTISSIIAGLQTQEVLKLIHGMPVVGGQAMVFNGTANRFYTTSFQRREDCLSHETYTDVCETSLSAGNTADDLFDYVNRLARASRSSGHAVGSQLHLDRDLVVALECAACDWHRPVLRPLQGVSLADACCPHCGQTARPRLEHTIPRGSELAERPLSELGVAPYDVLRIETGEKHMMIVLAGDRASVVA